MTVPASVSSYAMEKFLKYFINKITFTIYNVKMVLWLFFIVFLRQTKNELDAAGWKSR